MEWFLLNSGKVEGPFKAELLKEKLISGNYDSNLLACRQGDPHWKSLEEFKEQIFADANPDESQKDWILLTDNMNLALMKEQDGQYVQSGPYTTKEVKDLINSGQAKYSDFIWKTGFEKWMRINEVDIFFEVPRQLESSLPTPEVFPENLKAEAFVGENLSVNAAEDSSVSSSVNSSANSSDSHEILGHVLEQTQLNNYDFVDEEKRPEEASPVDHVLFKPLDIAQPADVEAPVDAAKFVLSMPSEAISTPEFQIKPSETSKRDFQNIYEVATRYFPWLMTALAGILVIMVGVWALSLNSDSHPQENAQAPISPTRKKQDKPAETAKQEVSALEKQTRKETTKQTPEIAAPTKISKVVDPSSNQLSSSLAHSHLDSQRPSERRSGRPTPKSTLNKPVEKTELHLIAWRLLKKAERLEQEYDVLKAKPVEWRRFYQTWQNDFERTTDRMKKHDVRSSTVLRQLHIGRGRLGERAQMMDRSIMESTPVSSDFIQEDLPGLFRNIQGQLKRH